MEQLIRSNYGDQEHYAHYYNFKEFNHVTLTYIFENQNPYDFGFIYYVTNDSVTRIVTSPIYECDLYSEIDDHYISYLCDENGYQYNVNKYTDDIYIKFDSEKLIREDDYMYINLTPYNTIYNNYGAWIEDASSREDFGGGVRLRYMPRPSSLHDNIYVYLANNSVYTGMFDPDSSVDMTDPNVLNGNAWGEPFAVTNEILHAYNMGDCYDCRNSDGSVTVEIFFNKIGKHPKTNEYSIFYGVNTWIYIYSSAGNFRGKRSRVRNYNYNNQTTPIETYYTFDHVDDYVGYNVIGFPIFTWAGGSYIVNYYDIYIR